MSTATTIEESKAHPKIAAHLAAPATVNFLLGFFLSFILPVLPSLLLAAAPKLKSPKMQSILIATDNVLDQLIDEQ